MSGWHIRDKLWPMCVHGTMLLYVHGNHKTGSLGRGAQDGQLDFHTVPELWFGDVPLVVPMYLVLACQVRVIVRDSGLCCSVCVWRPDWPPCVWMWRWTALFRLGKQCKCWRKPVTGWPVPPLNPVTARDLCRPVLFPSKKGLKSET